jgi:hypothetical protein
VLEQRNPLRYDERGKTLEDSSSRVGRHPALPVVAASPRGDHNVVIRIIDVAPGLTGEVPMLAQCLESKLSLYFLVRRPLSVADAALDQDSGSCGHPS